MLHGWRAPFGFDFLPRALHLKSRPSAPGASRRGAGTMGPTVGSPRTSPDDPRLDPGENGSVGALPWLNRTEFTCAKPLSWPPASSSSQAPLGARIRRGIVMTTAVGTGARAATATSVTGAKATATAGAA